jgi:hypothetical protein
VKYLITQAKADINAWPIETLYNPLSSNIFPVIIEARNHEYNKVIKYLTEKE